MPAARVEVEGLKELQKALRELKDKELKRQLLVANKTLAQAVVDEALPHVPTLTGKLRATVKAAGGQRDATAKAGTPSRVPYAAAIHWGRKVGNVGRPPGNHPGVNVVGGRPFLYEAKDRLLSTGEATSTYADALDEILRKVSAR